MPPFKKLSGTLSVPELVSQARPNQPQQPTPATPARSRAGVGWVWIARLVPECGGHAMRL